MYRLGRYDEALRMLGEYVFFIEARAPIDADSLPASPEAAGPGVLPKN